MTADDMLHIVTCAKQGDAFIPLDELTELKHKSPLYAYDSVRVTAWGEPLITDAQWTDVGPVDRPLGPVRLGCCRRSTTPSAPWR